VWRAAVDTLRNAAARRGPHLTFIIEPANWSIRQDGLSITSRLPQQLRCHLATTARGLRHNIVHFGSINTFFTETGFRSPHPSNKICVTIFHLGPNDQRAQLITTAVSSIDIIHTASSGTAAALASLEVPEQKINITPLGVDLQTFQPATAQSKRAIQDRLGLPPDHFIIGSFQKDGAGWGKGDVPKLIKGPDILVETLHQIAQQQPIHVLLVGPARGYVTTRLAKLGIPATHVGFVKSLRDVSQYYHALDAYLITSRVEGGPKQFLEAWASGVPTVSTPVGMIPDIAKPEVSILTAPIGNTAKLAAQVIRLITDQRLRRRITDAGQKTIPQYTWQATADQYYQQLYQPLL
jgi:glycosyltransferase involved in cell wall biosynthesis